MNGEPAYSESQNVSAIHCFFARVSLRRSSMTEFELSKILNAVGFSERYWALCERFPMHDGYHSYQGRKGISLKPWQEWELSRHTTSAIGQ